MSSRKMVISGLDEDANENTTPDSFVVDIESLSNGTDKDATPNSRITVKLQRNLSRKGSQRGERITTTLASGGVEEGTSNGSQNGGECNPGDRSNTIMVAQPPLGGVGTTEAIMSTQQSIKITAESRCRRYSRQRSSSAWMLDPRRVLFFFATLSSMGTIILIYFTLSMSRLSSGDDISQAQ